MLLLTTGFAGCNVLHDDLSKCSLYLQFRYDYNLPHEDWFAQQVEEVRVYVFDDNGFVQSYSESGAPLRTPGYRMELPYNLKGATAVVWAGRTADHYEIPVLAVGDPMEKLTLRFRPQNNTSALHIAPLWQSGPVTITAPEKDGTTQTISLVRDTNDITVSILSGNVATDPRDYTIQLTGANGSYDYRNNFLPADPQITYTPALLTSTTAMLYTLRLVKGAPLLFSVTDQNGRPILAGGQAQIDLTEYMLKGNTTGMNDQEYLDRRYLWNVTLNYDSNGYMAISLQINDWIYRFQSSGL